MIRQAAAKDRAADTHTPRRIEAPKPHNGPAPDTATT
jgi:hypothetical protein